MSLLLSELWIIFIWYLIKFLWNVLIFIKQLATLLLDTWEHWGEKDLVLLSPFSLQLFWGRLHVRMLALSPSPLCWLLKLQPLVTIVLFRAFGALGHGEGKISEMTSIIVMAELKAGPLIQPLAPLQCLPPVEAAFESWHFVGRNSNLSGRLGLQWKVDSKAAPGM